MAHREKKKGIGDVVDVQLKKVDWLEIIDLLLMLLLLLFRNIYDGQLMDQLHRILVSKSTFVERWTMKPRLNHQSRRSIYVPVEQ